MGTLFDQPVREALRVSTTDVDAFLADIKAWSKSSQLPATDVIAAIRVLELRRATDLAVRQQDILDEQLAGFGEILQGIQRAIEDGNESS